MTRRHLSTQTSLLNKGDSVEDGSFMPDRARPRRPRRRTVFTRRWERFKWSRTRSRNDGDGRLLEEHVAVPLKSFMSR